MRAILKSVSKQKCSNLAGQRRRKAFANGVLHCFERNSHNLNFQHHFSTNLLAGLDEDYDNNQPTATLLAQTDIYVLLNRLNIGFRSSQISSALIIENMKELAEAGVTIPTSFLFDAGKQAFPDDSRECKHKVLR